VSVFLFSRSPGTDRSERPPMWKSARDHPLSESDLIPGKSRYPSPGRQSAPVFVISHGYGAVLTGSGSQPSFLVATQVVGVDATQVGLIYTAGSLVNTVMLIPMGRLADRRDKKQLMILGMLLSAAALAGLGFTTSYPLLIVLVILINLSFLCLSGGYCPIPFRLTGKARRWEFTAPPRTSV
jgi:MFS family permease